MIADMPSYFRARGDARHAVHAASCAFALTIALVHGGCQSPQAARDFDPIVPQFLLEAPSQQPGAQVIELPVSQVQVPVYPRVALSQTDVSNVELVHVDLGLCLMFEFTPGAGRVLFRLSSSNIGRRLVVTLNGRPLGARLIEGPIQDGRLLVFVEVSDEELPATAVNLKRTVHEIQTALQRSQGR